MAKSFDPEYVWSHKLCVGNLLSYREIKGFWNNTLIKGEEEN